MEVNQAVRLTMGEVEIYKKTTLRGKKLLNFLLTLHYGSHNNLMWIGDTPNSNYELVDGEWKTDNINWVIKNKSEAIAQINILKYAKYYLDFDFGNDAENRKIFNKRVYSGFKVITLYDHLVFTENQILNNIDIFKRIGANTVDNEKNQCIVKHLEVQRMVYTRTITDLILNVIKNPRANDAFDLETFNKI